MKKSAIVFAMLFFGIALTSCDQQENIKGVTQLETAKTLLKKAEPTEFTFKTDAPSNQVRWSVSPNRNVQITPNGYTAKIVFGEAGRYDVIATDDHVTSRTMVTVDSTTYVPNDTARIVPPVEPVINPPTPPADTTTKVDTVGTHNIMVSLTGDEFILTPSLPLADSLKDNSIIIHIESFKKYDCMNSVLYTTSILNYQTLDVKILLSHVIQPGARFCSEGKKKVSASRLIYVRSNTNEKIEVELNGTTYSGSITRSGNTYNITWPYSQGVKFSKLTLTK